MYQLALLWEAVFGFSEFFLKILSQHLPISQWLIYEHTCPHHAECSAVFDQKMTPMPHTPYAPDLTPSDSFFFPQMKKSSKGNILPMWKRQNKTKTVEALKGLKIDKFKNCSEQWEKSLGRCVCIKWRVLSRWLKFKHARMNTWFFINKFHFGGSPLICWNPTTQFFKWDCICRQRL